MSANADLLAAHAEFHQKAAESARKVADREVMRWEQQEVEAAIKTAHLFDQLASLHDLAASGVLAFADCPRCHEIEGGVL